MSILRVENLSQSYGGLKVLQGVSFSLEKEEKVGLIGPNGAGKTTLLNVLNGLIPPIGGYIYIDGQEVTNMPPHKRAALGLARSFQLNTLFFNLNLLSNVLIAIQGIETSCFQMFQPITSYKEIFAEARELLKAVDLWQKRDVPINALSYGEQRQVEVLLALASKPKIFLLDEPSAGLTSGEIANLLNMIRSLAGDAAILFIGHDVDLVFALAERIMVLYYGEIIAQGTPKEIKADRRVREIYLGTEGWNA